MENMAQTYRIPVTAMCNIDSAGTASGSSTTCCAGDDENSFFELKFSIDGYRAMCGVSNTHIVRSPSIFIFNQPDRLHKQKIGFVGMRESARMRVIVTQLSVALSYSEYSNGSKFNHTYAAAYCIA